VSALVREAGPQHAGLVENAGSREPWIDLYFVRSSHDVPEDWRIDSPME
jgi:hypothetical protein